MALFSEMMDEASGKDREIARLRKGIQDYLDGGCARPGIHFKTDTCPHGLFGWEACENCIDAHFAALLKKVGEPA